MIYIFESVDKLDDNVYMSALKKLSFQRLKYIEKFSQPIDRYLSTFAYLLLVYGLKLEYGISEPQEFIYTEKGKPYLKNYNNIYFCLSHCKTGVCCAISDKEIGIDIESIRKAKVSLLKRVCSDEERFAVESSKSPDRRFIRFWTMKEAYIKMTGTGIGIDLREINEKNIPECQDMFYRDTQNYVMACTEKVKTNIVTLEQLEKD